MTFQDFEKQINQLHQSSYETKVLNALLNMYSEIKQQENTIQNITQTLNQVIQVVNFLSNNKGAAALNKEEDQVNEDTGAAASMEVENNNDD